MALLRSHAEAAVEAGSADGMEVLEIDGVDDGLVFWVRNEETRCLRRGRELFIIQVTGGRPGRRLDAAVESLLESRGDVDLPL